MTVLHQLMDRHTITAISIGRLEVGTESSVDLSKSIKSHLMALFQSEDPQATDIEGCDCVHACYGGTVALQNAIHWVESPSWDDRYAVVIMSDIAVYPPGPARPTSGAGAVALLVGPDAPLAYEHGVSSTYVANAYDFYKPIPHGIFPLVNGLLSVVSYLEALDKVYDGYSKKYAKKFHRPFALTEADFVMFHAPYNKLVQKAFARLVYMDLCRKAADQGNTAQVDGDDSDVLVASPIVPLGDGPHPHSPADMPKDLEKALVAQSFQEYDTKVRPSTCLARLCGNMYCASLWSGIPQIIETTGDGLEGRRILLYSYGSGMAGTMVSFKGRKVEGKFCLSRMQEMVRFL